jgi:hypothetical protein
VRSRRSCIGFRELADCAECGHAKNSVLEQLSILAFYSPKVQDMVPLAGHHPAQVFSIIAERIHKRIEVLRAVGLSDGFGVAISELQTVLVQIKKHVTFASVPSSSLKGH